MYKIFGLDQYLSSPSNKGKNYHEAGYKALDNKFSEGMILKDIKDGLLNAM